MNAAQLLHESSFDPWESVSTALKAVQINSAALEAMQSQDPTPRIQWLVAHLIQTKQDYWQAIGEVLNRGYEPPHSLPALLHWEREQAALLTETELLTPLQYSSRALTVAGILRLNARHSTWHAGQLAALARTQ